MKTITNKTLIKQGGKLYQPIEIDKIIYWISDEKPLVGEYCSGNAIGIITKNGRKAQGWTKPSIAKPFDLLVENTFKVVAQSKEVLDSLPTITIDTEFTVNDIKRTIELSRDYYHGWVLNEDEIINEVSNILVIEVNEKFEVIKYA
jgi:hypothetical protein